MKNSTLLGMMCSMSDDQLFEFEEVLKKEQEKRRNQKEIDKRTYLRETFGCLCIIEREYDGASFERWYVSIEKYNAYRANNETIPDIEWLEEMMNRRFEEDV